MGLDNFDIAPDNRGGRKQGEGEEEYGRRIQEAFTVDDDTEGFWSEQYGTVVGLGEPDDSHITELAGKLHLLPRTVKQKLTEHEVYEFDGFVAQERESKSTSLQALVDNAK